MIKNRTAPFSLFLFSVTTVFALFFAFTDTSHAGSVNVTKAKEFMKAQMFPQAITLLEKETGTNPTNAEAHFLLGTIYANNGDYYSADKRFASAISISPDKYGYKVAGIYRDAGMAAIQRGQIQEAEERFRKAFQYQPNQPNLIIDIAEAYKNIGILALGRGQIDEAKALFEKALSYKPSIGAIIAEECMKAGINNLQYRPKIAETLFSLALSYDNRLNERVFNIFFEKGKDGKHSADYQYLEKAKEYSNKHDEEILQIMLANGQVIKKQLSPNEIYEVGELKEGQAWRYLPFNGTIEQRNDLNNNIPWNIVYDRTFLYSAARDGKLQIRAKESPVTLTIILLPL